MNFIFWLSLAQAKQPYITEEFQMWHTYLGGTLIIATQGPDAYKVAQKSLQKDPSIPARIAPIPQMGKTDIHLSKVLRVNKAQCVLWVQPPNKKYAIETFGNCPKERKIQVIHREQFQSYLERIEKERIEKEKLQAESETTLMEIPKNDTIIESNKDAVSNNEISSKTASTEDIISLEGKETAQDTSTSLSSEKIEKKEEKEERTAFVEESKPELEKTFEPITMDPEWVPNQDWGVFDSNGTFIPPLTFSILTEYKPLEMTLRDELKQMNQKSNFIGLFSGALAVGGLLKLMTSTSSDTYVNVHSAWTSIFLFSTSGLFLYAKGIPAKELKLKQFALANYMTYEEAVLIDIQRQIQSSESTNEITEEKAEESDSKDIKEEQEAQSKDPTSTGRKRKLTFKQDLIQSKKDYTEKKEGGTKPQVTDTVKNKTNKDVQDLTKEESTNQNINEKEEIQEKETQEIKLEQSNRNKSSSDGDRE